MSIRDGISQTIVRITRLSPAKIAPTVGTSQTPVPEIAMTPPARNPIDYPAYVQKAHKLRAEALAAILADIRRWLRTALRSGGAMRTAPTR
jgi:hypothetical protein